MRSADPWYRFNCASVILRKVVPDRKIKVIEGNPERPIGIEFTDRREAVLSALDLLDDMDIDELRERVSNGNNGIPGTHAGTKRESQTKVGSPPIINCEWERPRRGDGDKQGDESPDAFAAG
jgi:hypothetical protein